MLRVVLDPGVLVAAVLSRGGTPAHLLRAWSAGAFELIASPHLLDELAVVFARSKFRPYLSSTDASEYVALLRRSATVVADPPPQPGLTSDPDDDYLVALSRSAAVDYLVSGDQHLTQLERPEPPVLTPRQFLTVVMEERARS